MQSNYQGYRCSLHQQSFEFYCERCLEPVCKKCTIIGPHHTQIHSLVKISIAYQRRVQQIRSRIQDIIEQNRQKIFKIISRINYDIQNVDLIRKSVDAQNNRQKQKLVLPLMKQFQNNINILNSYRQNLISKHNDINDLGYKYQTIENPIQLLGSHQKILQQLKQIHDRLQIILSKDIPTNPYTKELTNIRIQLKQIENLKQLYEEKIKIIQAILKKTKSLTTTFPALKIKYQELIEQINHNVSSIQHYVCHFCGLPFSFQQINKQCQNNGTAFMLSVATNASGCCKVSPDTSKLGTHRHFFGQPKNPFLYYSINASGSFKAELDAILLKAKSLCKLNDINIRKQFKDNDKTLSSFCQKIVFDYIFIEILGMTQKQKQVIICLAKKSPQNSALMSYSEILQQLEKIDV